MARKDRKPNAGQINSQSRKLRWLSGGSVAAAAALLAAAPQTAFAQSLLRAPGMMVENAPHGNTVSIPRPDMVQNIPHKAVPTLPNAHQPQNHTPDFHPRDVRISAPVERLPVNDIRISNPVTLPNAYQPQTRGPELSQAFQPHVQNPSLPNSNQPQSNLPDFDVQDIRITNPLTLPAAYQPQNRAPNFNPSEIEISAPAPDGLANIPINTLVPGLNEAQAFTPVAGQAFQGSITASSNVSLTTSTTALDVITVTAAEAFINWQPLDMEAATFDPGTGLVNNPINLLPTSRTLRFQSDGFNYTVLNRILPAATADGRPVQFNGLVQSFVDDAATTVGGNVWFYSPGGIIIGADSTFDVGGLVLTTNDITSPVTTGLFDDIIFDGVVDSTSAVTIEPGAEINALFNANAPQNDSYLAIVAPRINQGGDVNVDGSIAYVAAEAATISFGNGLMDISIPVGRGTSDAVGINHTGRHWGAGTHTRNGSFR